jgi:hypothetical protein
VKGCLAIKTIENEPKEDPMANPSTVVTFAELGINNRRTINGDLNGSRNATMLSMIGSPRGSYNTKCLHPTNQRIKKLMVTDSIGPFRVTGLHVAVEVLKKIMSEVRRDHREVHDALSSAGMLCCRLVRGSSTAISNHSWGTAVDFKLNGRLDRRGDGKTQRGLFDIHPIFNRHGFYWGAAFKTEDCMHFEASEQLIKQWASEGKFGDTPQTNLGLITIGDRGSQVEDLQKRLNIALSLDLDIDGIFGKDTRAVVMEYQRQAGLTVDGIIGPKTLQSLPKAVA